MSSTNNATDDTLLVWGLSLSGVTVFLAIILVARYGFCVVRAVTTMCQIVQMCVVMMFAAAALACIAAYYSYKSEVDRIEMLVGGYLHGG